MRFLLFNIIQLSAQQCKCLRLILKLRLFRLAIYHNTGRIMCQTHRRVCCIDTLTAVSGSTHHINTNILLINYNIYILRLRHHRNGNCRGVDPAAGFCFRHTLHTVNTTLIFQTGIGSLPGDHKVDFLHASDADFIGAHQFHLPAALLGIFYVKTIHLSGKQRRLISARTRTDFHNNVLIIIWVFRQQQNF